MIEVNFKENETGNAYTYNKGIKERHKLKISQLKDSKRQLTSDSNKINEILILRTVWPGIGDIGEQ